MIIYICEKIWLKLPKGVVNTNADMVDKENKKDEN